MRILSRRTRPKSRRDRPEPALDPLEHVLSLLSVRGTVAAPLHAGGRWGIDFAGRRDMRCETLVEGACLLTADGLAEPLHLRQGDSYLVVGRRRHRLGSDLVTVSRPANPFRDPDGTLREVARVGTGHDTTLVGVVFDFDVATAPLLLEVLPPVVHIPAASEHATPLREAIGLLGREARGAGRAREAVLDRLAQVVLVYGLRAYAQEAPGGTSAGGWLRAAADAQLGPVLRAVHADLAHPWTLPELARLARMSRSTFSLRFKEAVGASPLEYVLRLRMHAAACALRETAGTVAAIGAGVGYRTESAFSAAFRRVMGQSPGQYRRTSADGTREPLLAS